MRILSHIVIAFILACIALVVIMPGCTPVRYVYVDPKDSTIHKQRIVYDDVHDMHIPLHFQYLEPLYNLHLLI